MNILIIPSFLYTKKDPTLASFVFEQAVALEKSGNNVYLLYCDTFSIKYFKDYLSYSEQDEIKEGVHVYRTKAFCQFKHSSGFYGTKEIFKDKIISLFHQKLCNVKIDIIHAHCCCWAGYAAKCLSEQTNIPYIITEHSSIFALNPNLIRGKYLETIRSSFQSAKKVLCVSKGLERKISELSNGNVYVLGNVVDTNIFCLNNNWKTSLNQNQGNKHFRFLTVCYLKNEGQIYNKGIDLLLNAFSNVLSEYPFCHLAIGGGGAAASEVNKMIDTFGIQDRVSMLGPLSRTQVAEQMQQCDAFVLPSRYETFGVVYVEALACGKPVIGTKTGGPDSFVNENNGLLVNVDDVGQLTEAMKFMINKHDKYNPAAIRDDICKKFSSEAIADRLMQIYQEVLNS